MNNLEIANLDERLNGDISVILDGKNIQTSVRWDNEHLENAVAKIDIYDVKDVTKSFAPVPLLTESKNDNIELYVLTSTDEDREVSDSYSKLVENYADKIFNLFYQSGETAESLISNIDEVDFSVSLVSSKDNSSVIYASSYEFLNCVESHIDFLVRCQGE